MTTGVRAIVVDDERLAREGLASDLTTLGVHVVALCGDGHSAQEAIKVLRPDLLFLDVEMPEVDGFAVLEALEPEDMPPAVIFVTAYDQHAIRAFEARALDYLLKPVSSLRLEEAVSRAQKRVQESRALRDALPGRDDEPGDAYLVHLVIREREQVTIVKVDDLEWIEAETYYVRLHGTGWRPRLLRERMSTLEARLDPAVFFRSHRSAIVRLSLIRAVKSVSRYEHFVELTTGVRVPLSRDRRQQLEARLADQR